ncbi:MAG TPA: HIT family protein [Hyphomicrobiales bacterium]|nr:HIT family protein [Hyphomicrobiales bacterium]
MTSAYDPDNIFAKILRGETSCFKVCEDDATLVFMDIMPRAPGHALVIPKAPSRNVLDIAPEDLNTVMAVVQKVARAALKAFDAEGVLIQQFNEPASGQVVFHTHFHVIPRWHGTALKPHTGEMADQDELAANAEKLSAAIKDT